MSNGSDGNREDIYMQLDRLEHSLNAELEDLRHLECFEEPFSCDGGSDGSNSDGSSVRRDEERRALLLPPPPSWFETATATANTQPKCNQDESIAHEHETKCTTYGVNDEKALWNSPDQRQANKSTTGGVNMVNNDSSHVVPMSTLQHNHSSGVDDDEVYLFDLKQPSASPPLSVLQNGHVTSTSKMIQAAAVTNKALAVTLPSILHEFSSTTVQRSVHVFQKKSARWGPQRYWRASDIGAAGGRGYYLPESFRAEHETTDRSNVRSGAGVIRHNAATLPGSIAARAGQDCHLDTMWVCDGNSVRFTSLPWIERQMVHEWRTYEWKPTSRNTFDNNEGTNTSTRDDRNYVNDDARPGKPDEGSSSIQNHCRITQQQQQEQECDKGDDEADPFTIVDSFEHHQARTLAPRPLPRPQYENAATCYACSRPFSRAILHRHHCRRCGHSYCHAHSSYLHRLPHLGYDANVPERVCGRCKATLEARDLEERLAWRRARCRDFLQGDLTPYFEVGHDTASDAAYRLTRLAIRLARAIPLGAQAYVAIETVEVIRKHGLKGVYGLLLRKEFMAAADLLCK